MENLEYGTREAVAKIVPHKGKMLLLDRIRSYDFQDLSIVSEVDVTEQAMFFDEATGGIPAWLAFEYMAQSISALSGLYGISKGEPPKVGFIMSVSSFTADVPLFKVGQRLVIKVRQQFRVDMAVTFDGILQIDGVDVVRASLNTVEVDDPKKTLSI